LAAAEPLSRHFGAAEPPCRLDEPCTDAAAVRFSPRPSRQQQPSDSHSRRLRHGASPELSRGDLRCPDTGDAVGQQRSTRPRQNTQEDSNQFGPTTRLGQHSQADKRARHPLLIPRSKVRILHGPLVLFLRVGNVAIVGPPPPAADVANSGRSDRQHRCPQRRDPMAASWSGWDDLSVR
jgi:hypothetical protein